MADSPDGQSADIEGQRFGQPPHGYGSPVVGYVRSPRLQDPELDELEVHLRLYAQEHGYNLVAVLREEGISSIAAWRPELERLLRGLERREWVGVLIPSEAHLSHLSSVARRLARRIAAAGGWLGKIG
jgi:hypothetical protein